jgi:hypothetical protein
MFYLRLAYEIRFKISNFCHPHYCQQIVTVKVKVKVEVKVKVKVEVKQSLCRPGKAHRVPAH